MAGDITGDIFVDSLKSTSALIAKVRKLEAEPTIEATLTKALQNVSVRQEALYLLLVLDSRFVKALIPDIVPIGLSDRYAVLVRELLGRLPRVELHATFSELTRHWLKGVDYLEARRLAELLLHIGLDESLNELIQFCLAQDDLDLQELGTELLGPQKSAV